jgi:DNA-binding NarL/FixJ family response regulator
VQGQRQEPECVRFLLLHPRSLFRQSLATLLAAEKDFELVAQCTATGEALERIAAHCPHVVLFDFACWRELIAGVRRLNCRIPKYLGLTERLDEVDCARALTRGVSGVFQTSDSPARLVQAMQVVARGGAWVDQSVIQVLADRFPAHEELRLNERTQREQAVLRGILAGLSNRRIADQLGVTEGSIKGTIQGLFNQTGVRTRSQLVRIMLAEAKKSEPNQVGQPGPIF